MPLLYDTCGAFDDMDEGDNKEGNDLKKQLGVASESAGLRFLVAVDEDVSNPQVRLSLAPDCLVVRQGGGTEETTKFLEAVRKKPAYFAASVLMFVVAIAKGTYALPRGAITKARRWAKLDNAPPSDAAQADAAAAESASAASAAPEAAATDAQKPRLKVSSTCNVVWCHDGCQASCYVTLHRNRAVFFVLVLTL